MEKCYQKALNIDVIDIAGGLPQHWQIAVTVDIARDRRDRERQKLTADQHG
jgi:hypothetical protein